MTHGDVAQWLLAAGGFSSLAAIVIFAVAMARRVKTAEQIQQYRRDARLKREGDAA